MNPAPLCQIHQQPIIAIFKTQQQNGMCAICLSLLNDKIILLQDANYQIITQKQLAIENQKQITNQNIETLEQLAQQILEKKNSLITAFDKLLASLGQWKYHLKEDFNNIQSQIESIDTISMDHLTSQLQQLISDKNKSSQHQQSLILNTIKQIQTTTKFESIQQTIASIQFSEFYNTVQNSSECQGDTNVIKDTNTFQKTAKPILRCDEHKEEILFLDISSKGEVLNRLGCVDCQENNTDRKYTSIKRVKEKWEQYLEEKNLKLNGIQKQSDSIINQLKVYFEQLKNSYYKKVNDAIKFLNETSNNVVKTVCEKSNTIASDWSSLTKDELQIIAQMLIKQENLIIQDFINQDKIKQYVNEQVINLQEVQQHFNDSVYLHFQQNFDFYSFCRDDQLNDKQFPQQQFFFRNSMFCQTHKQSMLYDLNEAPAQKRILCPSCSTDDTRQLIDQQGLINKWKQDLFFTHQILYKLQKNNSVKQDSNIKNIQQLFEGILDHFTQIIFQKSNYFLYLEEKQSISDEEVLDLLQILSQPKEKTQIILENQVLLFENKLTEVIQDFIEQLIRIEGYCSQEKQKISLKNKQVGISNDLINLIESERKIKKELNIQTQILNVHYHKGNSQLKNQRLVLDIFIKKKEPNFCKTKIIDMVIDKKYPKLKICSAIDQQFKYIKAKYQLISVNPTSLDQVCTAIAFNRQSTIMVAAAESKIIVYSFQNGVLSKKQLLYGHTGRVLTLNFMKKTQFFVSGGYDTTIRIWKSDNNWQNFQCEQTIVNAHSKVCRVIMNKNEDLIISSGLDKYIKFWNKNKQWDCFQTLNCHKGNIRDITLNDSDNCLISTAEDKQIIVSQLGGDQKWTVIQKIQVQLFGYSVCFINDNVFTFQAFNARTMEVFVKKQNIFLQSHEVEVTQTGLCEWYTPQTFNKQKKILLSKNGITINIMGQTNATDFIVDQKIYLNSSCAYGAMTDDGEYLVIWDQNNKQFQVRKYQQ